MPSRRDLVVMGACAGISALVGPPGVSAAGAQPALATMATLLFNFKDEISPERTAALTGAMRALHTAPGIDGGLVGRNLNAVPFATRFEWIWMVQFATLNDRPNNRAYRKFQHIRDELALCCRDYVEGDLKRPLPVKFADAAGVQVRHTVMFDFKADASAEARARNVAAIERMGKLPMVRRYMVERTTPLSHGPAEMEWQVIGDFGSLADFKAYAEAPMHLDIGDDFKAHTARVAFLDVLL